jgi:hypothetical protein
MYVPDFLGFEITEHCVFIYWNNKFGSPLSLYIDKGILEDKKDPP